MIPLPPSGLSIALHAAWALDTVPVFPLVDGCRAWRRSALLSAVCPAVFPRLHCNHGMRSDDRRSGLKRQTLALARLPDDYCPESRACAGVLK